MSKKKRFSQVAAGYYGPFLPYFLAELSLLSRYDPDIYSEKFLKLGIPTRPKKGFFRKKSKLWTMYLTFGYYLWIIYIVACISVGTFSFLGALVGLLLTPFIVSGAFYSLNYIVNFLGFNKSLKK